MQLYLAIHFVFFSILCTFVQHKMRWRLFHSWKRGKLLFSCHFKTLHFRQAYIEDSISMAALTVDRVKKYYHRKTIILGVKTRSITQKVKNLPIVIFQQLDIRKYYVLGMYIWLVISKNFMESYSLEIIINCLLFWNF